MEENEVIEQLVILHSDTNDMLKRIESISYNQECPSEIKHRVLLPIRSKLEWFKNAMEAKLNDHIDPKRYKDTYNEAIELAAVNRMFGTMNANQQHFSVRLMRWILEGKLLNVEIADLEEEIF